MSIISGIFPSEIVDIDESGLPIYDRAVDEEYFAKYHSEFLSNGVYANPSNNFQVMANELMKLTVKAGSCFINGYYAYDNFDGEIILEPSSSDLNRIDRIVTRLDRINRKISIEVKKGAYGTASYSAPSLQRDDDIWELGLADVLVKKASTQIVQANITDLRAIQEYCGYVYNPMQNIDTTDLFAQYDNSFEVWFQHVKDQLSTDAAGNLQKQIDTHTSQLAGFKTSGGTIGTLNIVSESTNVSEDKFLTSKDILSLGSDKMGVCLDGQSNSLRPFGSQSGLKTLGVPGVEWKDMHMSEIGSVKTAIQSRATYNAGTWTPVLYCAQNGANVLTADTSGSYFIKIGNVALCFFYIAVVGWNTSWENQNLLMRGFPYAINKSYVENGLITSYSGVKLNASAYGLGFLRHDTSTGAVWLNRTCQSSNSFYLSLTHLEQIFILRGVYIYRV